MKRTPRLILAWITAACFILILTVVFFWNPEDTGATANEPAAPAIAEETSRADSPAPPPPPQEMISPEEQPRKFFVQDFDAENPPPDDYSLQGVVLKGEGFELAPQAEADPEGLRSGVIESTVQTFDFPVSAMVPLWKETLPDGTEVKMEYAVSDDGKEWSEWYEFHASHESEINPTYPDGRPNPNYGYASGGLIDFGFDVKKHFRFRATLQSETEESPVLSGVRLYYVDATLVDRES